MRRRPPAYFVPTLYVLTAIAGLLTGVILLALIAPNSPLVATIRQFLVG